MQIIDITAIEKKGKFYAAQQNTILIIFRKRDTRLVCRLIVCMAKWYDFRRVESKRCVKIIQSMNICIMRFNLNVITACSAITPDKLTESEIESMKHNAILSLCVATKMRNVRNDN